MIGFMELILVLMMSVAVIDETGSVEVDIEIDGSSSSVSSSVSNGPTYNAEVLLNANDKDCVESATVEGNGVSDTLQLPCTKDRHGRAVVNEKNKIVIGGDPGDPIGILGNKPNTLVVMEGGKCVERSYPPGEGPKETLLNDEECKAAKKEMQDTKKEAKEKEEKEKQQFGNIGKPLEINTVDSKVNKPILDLNDAFKSMKFGIKL